MVRLLDYTDLICSSSSAPAFWSLVRRYAWGVEKQSMESQQKPMCPTSLSRSRCGGDLHHIPAPPPSNEYNYDDFPWHLSQNVGLGSSSNKESRQMLEMTERCGSAVTGLERASGPSCSTLQPTWCVCKLCCSAPQEHKSVPMAPAAVPWENFFITAAAEAVTPPAPIFNSFPLFLHEELQRQID
ncbi:unnamed protein product [Pleuronectes platessa]|uniref:Uncharacterized protein n=1 Tax=Pleuronectes platessa TaxID=8262 RepID=A0A9N7YP09_PLEPL|nr:unnamed protein product [Pleuronectes platessa]